MECLDYCFLPEHVNLDDLAEHRLEISIFSTISINNYQVEVMITLALVTAGMHWAWPSIFQLLWPSW